MRIALVHYTYLPVIAGVELVMAEHARLFADAGHEVTIVCGRGQAAGGEQVAIVEVMNDTFGNLLLAQPGVREAPLAPGGLWERNVDELKVALRPHFAAHDVVVLHNVATMHFHPFLTAAVWDLAEEMTGVRFICWIHDLAGCNPDYAPLPLGHAPWNLLARAHPRFTYVAVSELRRRQFLDLTAQPPERCRTIPNGVHPHRVLDLPPRIADLARQHSLLDRDIVLLHPTRLLRRKNVELTLKVTAALKSAGQSCACLITAPPEVHHSGSRAYETALREVRDRLGLGGNAFFLQDDGALDDRELHALFRLADALFFPSRQEGFGIPILEAALHRLSVFCSDIEPLATLLAAGVRPFPLDSSPDEIAALIVRTLDCDAAFAARRQALRSYSWEAIYRNFLSPLLSDLKTA